VAASVYLAYTLEKNSSTVIAAGERAQSVPFAPGEKLQSFETFEPLSARYEWNDIIPRMTRPTQITSVNAYIIDQIYLKGISTKLKPHDPLLFVFREAAYAYCAGLKMWSPESREQNAGDSSSFSKGCMFERAISEVVTRYKNLEAFLYTFRRCFGRQGN